MAVKCLSLNLFLIGFLLGRRVWYPDKKLLTHKLSCWDMKFLEDFLMGYKNLKGNLEGLWISWRKNKFPSTLFPGINNDQSLIFWDSRQGTFCFLPPPPIIKLLLVRYFKFKLGYFINIVREKSLSMTGTGAESIWLVYEIFSIKFYGVWNFLGFLCWGIK